MFNKTNLFSFGEMEPRSNLPAISPSSLLASLAKSRSLTSCGETGTIANASLSSLIEAQPTCATVDVV